MRSRCQIGRPIAAYRVLSGRGVAPDGGATDEPVRPGGARVRSWDVGVSHSNGVVVIPQEGLPEVLEHLGAWIVAERRSQEETR